MCKKRGGNNPKLNKIIDPQLIDCVLAIIRTHTRKQQTNTRFAYNKKTLSYQEGINSRLFQRCLTNISHNSV